MTSETDDLDEVYNDSLLPADIDALMPDENYVYTLTDDAMVVCKILTKILRLLEATDFHLKVEVVSNLDKQD